MKKLISMIAVFALLLTLFAGCTVKPSGNDDREDEDTQITSGNETDSAQTDSPDEPADIDEPEDEDDYESGFAAGTPADSYAKYLEAKTTAMEKIYTKLDEKPDETWALSLSLLPITMVDLSLIPLTVFSSADAAGVEAALSFFSYSNIDFDVSGNTYTLSYDDGNGVKTTLVCDYDPSKDALSSTMTDDTGANVMFFEFVKSGSGYVSQYFYPDETNGGYSLLVSYFDGSVVAYGFKATNDKPASLLENPGIGRDILNGCDSTYVLDGDALTVNEEGEETVY
jgi:hypothetical protein